MQKRLLAMVAIIISVTSIGLISPAAAQARYCLQGRIWGYPGNCQFATYGQCIASASGTDAYCGINPQNGYARHRRWDR